MGNGEINEGDLLYISIFRQTNGIPLIYLINLTHNIPSENDLLNAVGVDAITDLFYQIKPRLQEIVHATKTILEVTPPELASDIVQHGLVLTGGGALLRNLDTLMRNELMIPVYVAENALHSVVDGCNIMLQNL